MSDLSKLIQKNAGTYGSDNVIMLTASVDSVSEAGRSCMVTPINDNIASFPALLMAETDDGLLILPTEGSTVKIVFSGQNAPTVIQFSQIDKIFIVAGGSTFLIYSSGIELMGNKYGGIPEVEALTTKYNNLEKVVNKLIDNWTNLASAYVPGSPTVTGLPASLTAPPFNSVTDLTLTVRSDIENTKVKHGDGS